MTPTPSSEFRRVAADLEIEVYRAIRTYAATNDISVISLIRALTETWANDDDLKARVLPRAREFDAESRRRRGGGR